MGPNKTPRQGAELDAPSSDEARRISERLKAALAAAKGTHKITVRPGPNAITKALERVKEPGLLRVRSGHYREAFAIDKRVRLVGVGRRRPLIDAECAARSTIEVRADDVRLRGLKVVGAHTANAVPVTGPKAEAYVRTRAPSAFHNSSCRPSCIRCRSSSPSVGRWRYGSSWMSSGPSA